LGDAAREKLEMRMKDAEAGTGDKTMVSYKSQFDRVKVKVKVRA